MIFQFHSHALLSLPWRLSGRVLQLHPVMTNTHQVTGEKSLKQTPKMNKIWIDAQLKKQI